MFLRTFKIFTVFLHLIFMPGNMEHVQDLYFYRFLSLSSFGDCSFIRSITRGEVKIVAVGSIVLLSNITV